MIDEIIMIILKIRFHSRRKTHAENHWQITMGAIPLELASAKDKIDRILKRKNSLDYAK